MFHRIVVFVTPSRVCELKLSEILNYIDTSSHTLTGVWVEIKYCPNCGAKMDGHTLTGVWVEICCPAFFKGIQSCHTLTGVWVEIPRVKRTSGGRISHTLTGVWVEIFAASNNLSRLSVTPSRVCELKYSALCSAVFSVVSHPHGCVSWNKIVRHVAPPQKGSHPHGCVSWNLTESVLLQRSWVTPSRVCELKFGIEWAVNALCMVTPSRVCELKYEHLNGHSEMILSHPHGCVSWNVRVRELKLHSLRHTLTGVWVEMMKKIKKLSEILSHPHGCVSWNSFFIDIIIAHSCHTLTGVWVEIFFMCFLSASDGSHPHGCVSWNAKVDFSALTATMSHPHGCVSWNDKVSYFCIDLWCHTLTGVWVEIFSCCRQATINLVTPSRVCELKWKLRVQCWGEGESHTLTGVWVEIFNTHSQPLYMFSHTLTGVWVEISSEQNFTFHKVVTPSRVCELKFCAKIIEKAWH